MERRRSGCFCNCIISREGDSFSFREKVQLVISFILMLFGIASFAFSIIRQEHLPFVAGVVLTLLCLILGLSTIFVVSCKYKAHRPAIEITLEPREGFSAEEDEEDAQEITTPVFKLTNRFDETPLEPEYIPLELLRVCHDDTEVEKDFPKEEKRKSPSIKTESSQTDEASNLEPDSKPSTSYVTEAEVYPEPESPKEDHLYLPTAATGAIPKRRRVCSSDTKSSEEAIQARQSLNSGLGTMKTSPMDDDASTKIELLERHPLERDQEINTPTDGAEAQAVSTSAAPENSGNEGKTGTKEDPKEEKTPCTTDRGDAIYRRITRDLDEIMQKGQTLCNISDAMAFFKDGLCTMYIDDAKFIKILLDNKIAKIRKLKKRSKSDIKKIDAVKLMSKWSRAIHDYSPHELKKN